MALTVVQHKVFDALNPGTTISVTVTATAAGNLLVVNAPASTITSGVTDNATGGTNTYVHDTTGSESTTDGFWYVLSAAHAGATTITAAIASPGYARLEFWEVSGFVAPAVDVSAHTNAGTGTGTDIPAPSVTTTSTTGFIAACCNVNNSITGNPKVGNEFTSGGDISPVGTNGAVSLISSTAAAHQAVWTDSVSADGFDASVLAFKETSTGATPWGWNQPLPQPASRPTRATPQSTFNVLGGPLQNPSPPPIGWLRPISQPVLRPVTVPQGWLAWSPFVVTPPTPPPFGWFLPFSQPVLRPITIPATCFAWSPQVITQIAPAAPTGRSVRFGLAFPAFR